MQHTRKASDEGWFMLTAVAFITPALGLGTLFFDMGTFGRVIFTVILLLVSCVAIAYGITNIRNDGIFICRLTNQEFMQSIPVISCGKSFKIMLSEVILIEVHDNGGEGSSDEWYLHTKNDRHRITANYGNPYRKFGQAIQNKLPQVETKNT